MRKKLTLLFALLCVSVMGFAIDWSGYAWLGNGGVDGKYSNKIKAVSTPELTGGAFINNLQMKGSNAAIHIAMPSAEFGAISLDAADYTLDGAGFFPHLDAFKKQETEFTVVCGGTTYTFTVYYEDGEPKDLTGWNIAKSKTAYAGHVAENGIAAANDGNKGTRWGSNGAAHYSAVGENAEDWWYVDLGDFYQVDQIKILFETAAPTDYDLLISNNAASWTVIGTYTTQPKTGNTDENYNVYDFTDKVGRYVKIFARNGYNNMQYGISIWEFEVYGDHASIDDHNPPTMTSASLSGDPSYDQVNIAVAGTDPEDGVVTQFHVVDATHGVDQSQTAEAGVITVTGLNAETSYTFTITALDAAGNESANSVNVAATTAQDTSIPLVAAPVPSGTGKEIRPIYCDAFASILEHDFKKDGFAGVSLMMEQNISGDHCLVYNVAGANEITWGHYNSINDEICAQSEYRGSGMGVDASAMEYLHIDIWSLQAGTNVININVNDAGLTSLRLSHSGNGWQGYDIAMSDFGFNPENPAYSSDNVRWMKFNGIGFISGKMALDNVYFWKTATGLHAVSAKANNASYGTASVVVTETGLAPEGGLVTDGTEVTFSATPNDGYIFVDWSNGNTNATFNATVDAAMNLTANFRALGTTYCNTLLHSSNGGQEHDAYVTMKRSGENEYQLIVRSSEELHNFGGTNFYKPINTHVIDIRNQGVLSNNNHTLTVTFNADKEPYMTNPLYVVLQGGFEAEFPQLTNIEYSQPCADPEITAITLDKTEATMEMGNTLTLVPTFTPAYMSADITWQTSDADVASVEDGVVTANAIGTATITAETSNGKTATCAVTVEPITEKTWWGTQTITDWDPDMDVMWSVTRNANKTLTYTVYFGGDASGKVKQINNGEWHGLVGYDDVNRVASYTTETTYETGTKIKPDHFFYFGGPRIELADVYVVGSENERPSTAVESVEISSTAASLLPEENLQLTATVLPSFVENKNVNWSSDNKSVATVTNTGYVTAVADGTAHITATSVADGTKSATCTITVVSSITAATWYGYSTVSPLEGLTAYTYSITRGTDHKLTFTMTTDKNVVGYVSGIEGDVTGVFGGYDAVNHTGTFTTAGTYTDGAELHLRLTFASASYGAPAYNFSYTVGSSNAALPQAVAVDETKDNSGILTTYDGETVVGVLGRSFVADNLYTLVVPFNVDAAQTAAKLPGQLTKLNNSYEKANGDLRINFVDASAIEAGVPYLYQPSANVTNPAFVGVSVSKDLNPTEPADGLAKYYGIYAPMDGDALHAKTNAYVLGPDQYLYAVSDLPDNQTMAALRAYFVLNFPSAGPGAPKRLAKVVFNSNETETTTDVTEVQTDNTCIKVIVNGQLQIIRDGKTYNAFGQLVK